MLRHSLLQSLRQWLDRTLMLRRNGQLGRGSDELQLRRVEQTIPRILAVQKGPATEDIVQVTLVC